jgi:hypothetical protein
MDIFTRLQTAKKRHLRDRVQENVSFSRCAMGGPVASADAILHTVERVKRNQERLEETKPRVNESLLLVQIFRGYNRVARLLNSNRYYPHFAARGCSSLDRLLTTTQLFYVRNHVI